MKATRNKVRLLVLVIGVSGFLIGFALISYFGQPERRIWIWGNVAYVVVGQVLHIEVTPMGYPVVGQSWTINVYWVNTTKDGRELVLSPSPNSTVNIKVNRNGIALNYDLAVNLDGQTTFQFSPELSDVAFQAFNGDSSSNRIVVSAHFVPSDVVDSLALINLIFGGVSVIPSILSFRRAKAGTLLRFLSTITLCILAFVSIFSLYSRFFQNTAWGYPENLFDGWITFTLLKYLTIIGVTLLVSLVVLVIIFARTTIKTLKEG